MAAKYWVGRSAGPDNWNATGPTPWSNTDGGANNATAPTSTDDVIFNGNGAFGNSSSVINGTRTILSLTITAGYTATMTHNAVLTVAGNWTMNNTHTIAGSSSITISATSTITSNGQTWPNNMTWGSGAFTVTLVGNFTINGPLTITGQRTINATTLEILTCAGISLTQNVNGTASIILTGGTWTQTGGRIISNNLTLNGVTVSGIVLYESGTLTYISGTVTGSTLTISGGCTLDIGGVTWSTILLSSPSGTITLNSLLVANTLSQGQASCTFGGSFGFTVDTLSWTAISATTFTLQEGVTYTITSALTANTSRVGSIVTFTSSHGTNKAILTLQNGATCACLANFTRIDASGGRPIRAFNSTITDCVYIQGITDLKTMAA